MNWFFAEWASKQAPDRDSVTPYKTPHEIVRLQSGNGRAPPRWRRPDSVDICVGRDRLSLLELGVRLQHEIPHTLLRRRISDGAQQRKAAALTVDRVLTRRKRDVAATAAAALPHGKPDQLQAVEHAVGEVQLGIREFAGRVGFVVRNDLDDHDVTSLKARLLGERLTPTSECESCRDLAGCWGLKPLPKPVLQRVEADEPGIRRQQLMLLTAVLRSLPGELHRIHEHKARVCLGA